MSRLLVLVLAALVIGRASPAPPTSAPSSGPRFAASGPGAEDYGASNGYPIGDRRTFYSIPVLVGSHSHMVSKQSVDPGRRETGALWQRVVRTLGR